MQIKLLSITNNAIEIMFIAARTCYSTSSSVNLSEKAINLTEAKKLIKQVLNSGHHSIAEHINLTFAIEGISRACSHQLVRHRHCTFSQQSQRYVEIKEDINQIEGIPHTEDNYLKQTELIEMLDKYFVWDHNSYAQFHSLINSLYCYLYLTGNGVKAEDARALLPNCTKTNLVMTCNLRELMHICNLRLCTRAQKEIRDLFKGIKKEVTKESEFIGNLLLPTCKVQGFCTEHRSCGKEPNFLNIKGRINDNTN